MFSKTNEPNSLNYFDCRKFSKKPDGLQILKLQTDHTETNEHIEKWILENLKGRYYIGRHLDVDRNGTIKNYLLVAFESPKELSIFNLSCPYIQRH
jgi:hypothetical protein|tara:strand:- start:507 stop:794 length:288 start_codon:yes stop_codon:yes gene_type:complete